MDAQKRPSPRHISTCRGTSDFTCLSGSVDGTSDLHGWRKCKGLSGTILALCRRRTPGSLPGPLRGRASAALILGSTEGAKEPAKFKTNKNACQTLNPFLRVLQLGSNSLKQETLPGVVQKPLAICRRKALILQTSGSVRWGVQKQMFFVTPCKLIPLGRQPPDIMGCSRRRNAWRTSCFSGDPNARFCQVSSCQIRELFRMRKTGTGY